MDMKQQINSDMKKILVVLALLAVGVTAASAQKVRVMTYNLHNCVGSDGIKSYVRCGDLSREAQPDIVAIQEADSMTTRNECYVLGEVAKRAGYHAYYGPTIPYKGGKYGIGVLSKDDALSVEFHRLPCRREPRGLLVVEYKKFYLLATHLSLVEADRLTSVEIIRDVASKLKKPVFIAGDMNARPTSKPMMAFKEFCSVLSDENKFTISANKPRACIDYVLGTNGSFKVLNDHVFYGTYTTDHIPLYVDVKVGKAKKSKR